MRAVIQVLDAKLEQYRKACAGMGQQETERRQAVIKQTVTKADDTLQQQRTDEFVVSAEAKMYNEPRSTVGLRRTDVDLTPCTLGKVPLSDLVKARHEIALNMEILSRHLVPFVPFPGRGNKRTHPVPKITPITGIPLDEMLWTDKKDLLMLDEERRWRVENPDGDIADFHIKSFAILGGDEVDFDFTSNS